MLITVQIFVGGTWILLPNLHYVDAEEVVFQKEHDQLTLHDIREAVVKAGYIDIFSLEAKYPSQEFEIGCRSLRKEKHVKRMVADMVRDDEDIMEVYVEHGVYTPVDVINVGSDEEMKDAENVHEEMEGEKMEDEVDSPSMLLIADLGHNEGNGTEEVLFGKNVPANSNDGPASRANPEDDGPAVMANPEDDGPAVRTNLEEDGPRSSCNFDAYEALADAESDEETSRDNSAERTYSWEKEVDGSSDDQFSDFVDSLDDEDDLFDAHEEEVDMNIGGEHMGGEQPRSDRVTRPPVGRTGPGVPDVETDYEDSDTLDTPPCSDSDEESKRLKMKFPEFYEDRDFDGEIKLEVGLKFASVDLFRKALRLYSIQVGHDYIYVKNESKRVTASCKKNCGWRIHASPSADRSGFQIKSFNREHYCGKDINHGRASARWIAEQYLADFKDNPELDLEVLGNRVRREKFITVSHDKLIRARNIAGKMIEGEHGEQYKQLWRYAEAIRISNPDSSVKIITPNGVFQCLYMCLDACKRGFLRGCRPFIGIDGCHLKGRFKGHLLSAVGKDANGNIFPIAWAVVDSECKENWLWFLERLKDDIGPLEERCFMSDRQKGLQNIFDTVLKDVDHRYCVRHIWNNFKVQFGGSKYMKDLMWAATRACTVTNFNLHLEKIRCENPRAYDWLKRIPPQRWSRHAFNSWVRCDLLLNNLSESFNSYVRLARKKPILTCLEVIRRLLMKRFYIKYQGMLLYEGNICPRWFNRLETWIQDCQSYIVYPHSQMQKFEVEHINGDKSICDLTENTCSCKRWNLTGVPCRHVCAAYLFMRQNPHDHVHCSYKKTTFLESYKHGILPVPDQSEWPLVEGHYEVRPPARMAQSGRPRTKRRREPGEAGPPNPRKVKKTGLVMTCRNCRASGHNTRSCPVPMRADIPPLRRRKKQAPAPTGHESVPEDNGTSVPPTPLSQGSPPVVPTQASPHVMPTQASPPVVPTQASPHAMPTEAPPPVLPTSTPSMASQPDMHTPSRRTPLVIPYAVPPMHSSTQTPGLSTTQRPKQKRMWKPTGFSGSFLPPRPTTSSSAPKLVQPPLENPVSKNHILTRKWIP